MSEAFRFRFVNRLKARHGFDSDLVHRITGRIRLCFENVVSHFANTPSIARGFGKRILRLGSALKAGGVFRPTTPYFVRNGDGQPARWLNLNQRRQFDSLEGIVPRVSQLNFR
jgi:hypothetical protein